MLRRAPASLRTFVVWVPAVEDDDPISALAAGALLGDDVEQFFDDGAQLSRALGAALRIPFSGDGRGGRGGAAGLALEVYLLYAPGTLADAPPYFWMTQLSQVPRGQAPRLDGRLLRARLDELVPPGAP